MSFLISALPKSKFEHLFASPAADHVVRTVATKKPGFPCRVSLADAEIGEEVVLIHYEHQSAATPFRSSHAIYVRPNASQANLDVNEVPAMLRSRVLSLRAFDEQGMMVAADLAEGAAVEKPLEELFADPSVAYIHIHFAKPGCYAARADRVKA
jgi:hypothetical protein